MSQSIGGFGGSAASHCGNWGRQHKKGLGIFGMSVGAPVVIAFMIGGVVILMVNFVDILKAIGFMTVSLAAITGLFGLGDMLEKRRKAKKLIGDSQKQVHSRPFRDTVQLIGRTAVAKKHSICPLVFIDADESTPKPEPIFKPLVSPAMVARLEQEAVDGRHDRVLEPA